MPHHNFSEKYLHSPVVINMLSTLCMSKLFPICYCCYKLCVQCNEAEATEQSGLLNNYINFNCINFLKTVSLHATFHFGKRTFHYVSGKASNKCNSTLWATRLWPVSSPAKSMFPLWSLSNRRGNWDAHMLLSQSLSMQNDVTLIGTSLTFKLLALYLHGFIQQTIDDGFITDCHVDDAHAMDRKAV